MQPAGTSRLCAEHLPPLGAHQSSLFPASHLNESSPDVAPRIWILEHGVHVCPGSGRAR